MVIDLTFSDVSDSEIQTWALTNCVYICTQAEYTPSTCQCQITVVQTSARRLLSKNAQLKLKVPSSEKFPTNIGKVDKAKAAALSSSNGSVKPTAAKAFVKTEGPTEAPTPEPTISWQSRFLFWIWLTQFLRGIGG